jgi:hypothetical protein
MAWAVRRQHVIYTSAVRKLKERLDNVELGKLYYSDPVRVNLGMFAHDIEVLGLTMMSAEPVTDVV